MNPYESPKTDCRPISKRRGRVKMWHVVGMVLAMIAGVFACRSTVSAWRDYSSSAVASLSPEEKTFEFVFGWHTLRD